jgi:hypothetical protein
MKIPALHQIAILFLCLLIIGFFLVQIGRPGFVTKTFTYNLHGNFSTVNLNLSSDIYDKVSVKPQPVLCYRYENDASSCNNEEIRQYFLKYLDDPVQKKSLDEIVQSIKTKTSDKDDRARIAMSLVQNIPYDYSKANPLFFQTGVPRYPYMVLYEKSGLCEEKSILLAYLLRELGYGVVLFEFSPEKHMAVGIKCPAQYSFNNSGFAFVETTGPAIPTDSYGDYVKIGKLTSNPQIISISDGSSFMSIDEEYRDVQLLNQLNGVLDESNYSQMSSVERKYGIIP